MNEENNTVWFINESDTPEDYKEVSITSRQVDDPQGSRRFNSNGTCTVAKVWIADLERGGVTVESYEVWSQHPPIDVVIHKLDHEQFKLLLGRTRDEQDNKLTDPKLPDIADEDRGMLGSKFQ